jgi:hypothetical protein
MKRLVILVVALAVFVPACGQGAPAATPSSTPTHAPAPTATPIPTQTTLTTDDEEFQRCFGTEVLPHVQQMRDCEEELRQCWEEKSSELDVCAERLADHTGAALMSLYECPLPDKAEWRHARVSIIEGLRYVGDGAQWIRYGFTHDTMNDEDHEFDPDSAPEPAQAAYREGIEDIDYGLETLEEALLPLPEE